MTALRWLGLAIGLLACFEVRGRLSARNGAPAFRLRPLGTRRLPGVVGGDGDAASPAVLPPVVRAAMAPRRPGDLRSVVGSFRVCPLAPDRAGRMRPVCIAAARSIARARWVQLNAESRSTLLNVEQDSAFRRFRLKPSCSRN